MAVHHPPHTAALLVGAGESRRMASLGRHGEAERDRVRKPFMTLCGTTIVELACLAFERSTAVREIVIVGHADDLAKLHELAKSSSAMRKVSAIVPGGALRVDSVRAGMEAMRAEADLVAIHDVARPLVTTALVDRAIAVAALHGAALVAVQANDTLKISSDGRAAESTLDRRVVWCAQTPQVFRTSVLRELLVRAQRDGFRPTDDSALHEKYLGPVPIVPGEARNVKITTPEDLVLCESLLRLSQASEARRP